MRHTALTRHAAAVAVCAAVHGAALGAGAQAPDSSEGEKKGPREPPPSALFDDRQALPLTLSGDIATVTNDRDPKTAAYHPLTLIYTDSAGARIRVGAQARTRGLWRRAARNCTWPPLRLRLDKKDTKGTIFHRRRSLKLVTPCRNTDAYEQYVLREYLVYRIYNLLTPRSFRVRLVRVTYSDAASHELLARYGFLVEDDGEMAARNAMEPVEAKGGMYQDFDPDAISLATAFQYMVGNTDWSLAALHNMTIMQSLGVAYVAVPYDFDFAGVVETPYATPDPHLRIGSVRDRVFRGNCRTPEEWAPIVSLFNDRRSAIYALYDSVPALDRAYVTRTRSYFDEFYRTINDRRSLREAFIEPCRQYSSFVRRSRRALTPV